MRNLLLLLACLALFSCKKGKNSNTGPINPIYGDTLKFDILGLQDTTMEQTDTLEYNVQVQYIEGAKDIVTLAVSDFPASMTAGFYPQIDTPTFFSVIRIRTNHTDTGTYTIKATAAGLRYSKDYYIKIRVVAPPVNPASILAGAYLESGLCGQTGTVSDTVKITTVSPYYNKIQLQGLKTGTSSINVIADIDPSNNTLLIPYQSVSGQTFSGSGTYTNNTLTINYTYSSGPFLENCSTVLTKL